MNFFKGLVADLQKVSLPSTRLQKAWLLVEQRALEYSQGLDLFVKTQFVAELRFDFQISLMT